MNIHKQHNVLGAYCWTCQKKTEAGVPGWSRPSRGPIVSYSPWVSLDGLGTTEAIVWANGDVERHRDGSLCSLCDKHCANPVSRGVTNAHDGYREIYKSQVKES